ncbi:MAG TPA: GGDEF domain-containing protein [Desulfovibrio sp.]|nr:GGDEF domain-containing protein [Desulfovibrio sp.]
MKPTDLTLNEQMRITAHEIVKRKGLLDITDEDAANLKAGREGVIFDLDTIVDHFYGILVEIDEVPQLIGDAESLYRLKNYLRGYIRSLFSGDYDVDYVQSRLRIGLVHKRIGVPPKLYVAAFQILSGLLREKMRASVDVGDCRLCAGRQDSLEKLMLFDLVLVFDTYIQGLMDEVKRGREDVENYARDLEQTVADRTRELAEQARKDGMTGLYNQKTFFELIRKELSRSQRRAERFSLCYIDLDKFKQANDTLGHKYGDSVLINVAKAMGEVLRGEDIGARYGGDEFCVLLPHTEIDGAVSVCERLIEIFDKIDTQCMVTMSIGVAEYLPDSGMDADTLIKQADRAMYESKKSEGYKITVYSSD